MGEYAVFDGSSSIFVFFRYIIETLARRVRKLAGVKRVVDQSRRPLGPNGLDRVNRVEDENNNKNEND